jgi:hypothetical protein
LPNYKISAEFEKREKRKEKREKRKDSPGLEKRFTRVRVHFTPPTL